MYGGRISEPVVAQSKRNMRNFLGSLSAITWAGLVTVVSFFPVLGAITFLQSQPLLVACFGYLTLPALISYLICRIFLWLEFGRWK